MSSESRPRKLVEGERSMYCIYGELMGGKRPDQDLERPLTARFEITAAYNLSGGAHPSEAVVSLTFPDLLVSQWREAELHASAPRATFVICT